MEKEYIVGIDFGHGETSAWIVSLTLIADNYEGESLRLSPANRVSLRSHYSVIYYSPKNGYSLGNLLDSPILGFKNKVSILDNEPNLKNAYKAYIQAIYERLLKLNTQLKVDEEGDTNFYLCIACPTKWDEAEKEKYIKFFNVALEEYSIEVMWVINESDAAYFSHGSIKDYHDKCVLIIDYGSSTIDYTVVYQGKKISDDNWSNQLGASKIETSILAKYQDDEVYQLKFGNTELKLKELDMQYIDVYSSILLEIRTQKELSVIEDSYPEIIRTYNLIGRKTAYSFSDEFKNSRNNYEFEIVFPDIYKIDAIRNYQEKVIEDFKDLNDKIRQKTGNNNIDLVILSGGACQMPWIQKEVQNIFNPVDIDLDNQASFVVAKGIALYARAQINALQEFLDEINNLDFRGMYIKADTNATAKAVQTMMPDMIRLLKSNSPMTGLRIRQSFCDFVETLNGNNYSYCNLVQQEFDSLISSSVRNAIKSVILSVFKVDKDTSDVKLHIPIGVINWSHSLFVSGGAFYDAFTTWIDNAANRWSFSWDKLRYDSELSRIVDGTANTLENIVNSGQIADYPQDSLNAYAENIKEQVIDNAVKIFYNKQLFSTTFKN